jgi:hypothetical protein
MNKRIYETDDDYILDILEDEEERLIEKLIEILPEEIRHLFYRYLTVRATIKKIKAKIA